MSKQSLNRELQLLERVRADEYEPATIDESIARNVVLMDEDALLALAESAHRRAFLRTETLVMAELRRRQQAAEPATVVC